MAPALRAVLAAAAVLAASASAVIELTADNFDTLTKEGEWLVDFYAPWCGHCKRLEPIWEQAAEQLAGKVNVAKVDATKYRSLGLRFDVKGFPTIFHINANGDKDGVREVRRAALQHNLDSIRAYALGGWRQQGSVIPTLSGPYGPTALAKFHAMTYGDTVISWVEPISKATGLPTVVVQFSFMMVGLLAITGAIIGLAVWLGPKQHAE